MLLWGHRALLHDGLPFVVSIFLVGCYRLSRLPLCNAAGWFCSNHRAWPRPFIIKNKQFIGAENVNALLHRHFVLILVRLNEKMG